MWISDVFFIGYDTSTSISQESTAQQIYKVVGNFNQRICSLLATAVGVFLQMKR